MPSPYEALKVQNLIRTYRANPMMFNDDQLDELERLASDNLIEFKRTHSDFSLKRGLQQAQAGFLEGLTTFNLIPKEPRNTGEAIFRQLGHLAGFAPGILKAPVMGLAKLGMKATGRKQVGRFTQATLDGIDVLDRVSVPMFFSRGTKKLLNKGLTKTGAESLDFLKHGSRTRAIAEEALGLASASAVSNVWKGEDAIVDSYVGGLIAGGAFGGIGNFVSVGNLYKGNAQQVETANKMLRTSLGAMVTGLPSTLRGEPTEMQIYEYLLGGFFGYNTRPAREVEAAKWINRNRSGKETFRPQDSKDWDTVNSKAKEFILYEHPMGYEMSGDTVGGSSGIALGYLNRWSESSGKSIDWRANAERHFEDNKIDYTEKDVNDYYRDKAYGLYKINKTLLENAVVYTNAVLNNDQMDMMDTAEKDLQNIKDISENIFEGNDKFSNAVDVGTVIDNIAKNSIKDGKKPNVELFMKEITNQFGDKVAKDQNKRLRGWYRSTTQKMQPLVLIEIGEKNAVYGETTKEKIGDKDIGEKFNEMPINDILPESDFMLMTHVIKKIVNDKGVTEKQAFKILEQSLEKGEIKYSLNSNDLGLMQSSLAENNRYIVHGVKDKDFVLTSLFRDEGYTLDNIFDILSQNGAIETPERIREMYNRSLALEKEIFGDTPKTEELHERKFISNVVNLAQMNNLPVEQAWAIIDPKQNFGSSVADLNKRVQLMANRMTPMVKESFEGIEGTNNGETFRIVIIDDPKTVKLYNPETKEYEDIKVEISDSDGLMEFRSDFIDASTIAMGRNSNNTGHFKPVIAVRTEQGFLGTKSNGQEAFPALNDWMKANNIHAVVYGSAAKLAGNNPKSTLKYKEGKYESDNLQPIEIPIEKLQISSGTYENTGKDVYGTSMPIQLYGQSNEVQAEGYADVYIRDILEPSLKGSKRAVELVNEFRNTDDVEAFRKKFVDEKMDLDEMPYEFMSEILINRPDSEMGKLISDRIMKLDLAGELDQPSHESFEPDTDSAFRKFHDDNRNLTEALRGTYVAKHTMSFNKNNYFNALRKYFTKRISNPYIHTGGKSWLKGFTPDMMSYVEIDPAKKNRLLEEGEIYLDNGFKQMPVVFRGESNTLGKVWDLYLREHSAGLSEKAKKEFDQAFSLLTIRTPADSISGIRKLRFKGWTNQKGAGSFTHHKDNTYLGGADKDSDSIKIFQGMNKELIDFYEVNRNERKHWNKEYESMLEDLFQADMSEVTRKDFMDEKFMMFSPSHRFQVAKNASTGKQGLGYGLSAKIAMQNMYDYINANGGNIKIPYSYKTRKGKTVKGSLNIRLKENAPMGKEKAHRFFLDLGTMIVNKSADASKDPNVRPYNQFRDLLYRSLFDVTEKGKSIDNYSDFIRLMRNTEIGGIKEAIDNIKPRQYNYEYDRQKKLFEVLDSIKASNNKMGYKAGINTIYPKLNQKLENLGFTRESFMFENLVEVQNLMYDTILGIEGFYRNASGKLEQRNNIVAKYLSEHYNIIASELSFATSQRMRDLMVSNPEQALEFIGKELGQYATMELLTDQFIKIQNEFAKQGRTVNVVEDVYPKIKEAAFEIKEFAREIHGDKARDNAMNVDLDGKIYDTMSKLAALERSAGLTDGLLQDYFSYWLLSPIRPLKTSKDSPQYFKPIHASRMVPMRAKRSFYQRMDTIYNRVSGTKKPSVDIKMSDMKKTPLNNNAKVHHELNEIIKSKEIKGLAIYDVDVKEIEKFQSLIDDHPILGKDFNNWFMDFTSRMGSPRDATTMDMSDFRMVNNYWKSMRDNSNMELKLMQFYEHPMTTDEKMVAKNIIGSSNKIKMTVMTSKGPVVREVSQIMSPIGIIGHYFKKSQAGLDKYTNFKPDERAELDKIIGSLKSPNERDLYMDSLIEVREGRLPIDDLPKEINRATFDKLNSELTNFNEKMWNKWVSTKGINKQDFDWDTIDNEHTYGRVNEYIRYDKNGRFDFELFQKKVIDAVEQSDKIIGMVGIDGVRRYRYEYLLEKRLYDSNPKNRKEFRELQRKEKPFKATFKRKFDEYVHHSLRNVPEGIKLQQAEWIARKDPSLQTEIARQIQQENPFVDPADRINIDSTGMEGDVAGTGVRPAPLQPRGKDPIPFKRSYDLINDYQNALISGYFRNLMKFKAQNEIDIMLKNMRDYQPSKSEEKRFKDLYKGVSDIEISDKLRYKNYVDVWADYVRLYAEDSLGYQSHFSEKMMTEQGRELLHLNKKNMYYNLSDDVMVKGMEKLYQSKLGKKEAIPFFNNKAIPKDPQARKEYFTRVLHDLGRGEAQYELLTLLANTGTWTTNIFGGATMAIGSAGVRNYMNSFSNDRVYRTLLSDKDGNSVLKLLSGKEVRNRKDLMTYLEERGVIDNFIQNEFEYNSAMTSRLKNAGVNIKDFQRDLLKAMKSKKGNRDESVRDVAKRYGVKDLMLKYGGFLMKQSERVNRLNAFTAHAMQAVEGFGAAGRNMSLADPYVFQQAEKGIEMTQFLYQNAFRPPFMRTAMGKVMGRFKLFAFNSVRIRKEFYRQAKLQGFKPGTESYERFKDTFTIDMFMYALGAAFMFSIFDTTLPPPWDWVQAMADWTFGDKREKDMAFFGSKLGPLNVLKPPIARIPEAFGELLTGQYKDFTGYTMYTLFPFGRGVRQLKQLADPRPFHGVERAPEILFRFPYHQMISRINKAKKRRTQISGIEEILGEA